MDGHSQGSDAPAAGVTEERARAHPEYDGVAIVLTRLVPSLQFDSDRALLNALHEDLRRAFRVEPHDMVTYCCMGRQDVLSLIRTREPERVGHIYRPRGVRKIDTQYGYLCHDTANQLFGATTHQPLVLAMYGKLSDPVVAAQPVAFDLADVQDRWFADLGLSLQPQVIRTLGWNDVLLLQEYDSMADLLDDARRLWDMAPPQAAVGSSAGTLFLRTYTIMGYHQPCPAQGCGMVQALQGMHDGDKIPPPRIEMRIRPGYNGVVGHLAEKHLSVDGYVASFATELGHEDGTVLLCPEPPGHPLEQPTIEAQKILQAYYQRFLPSVRHFVHSTQLCIEVAGDKSVRDTFGSQQVERLRARAKRQFAGHVGFHYLEVEDDAREFVERALANNITASAVDCLHAFYEACDWSIENEALRTTFGDLFWHLKWLLDEYQGWGAGLASTEALGYEAEELGAELKVLADGFAQRLAGAYYGIMGYQPEHLFSHTMSLHKIVVGLWALHTSLFLSLVPKKSRPDFKPRGCWGVSYGHPPMLGSREKREPGGPIAQLPSRGVLALETIVVDTAHEIGHMVFNAFVNARTDAGRRSQPYDKLNFLRFYRGAVMRVGCQDLEQRMRQAWDRIANDGSASDGADLREGLRPLLDAHAPDAVWGPVKELTQEAFADALALHYYLEDDYTTYLKRLLDYLTYHQGLDATLLVLRSFVQFCETNDGKVAGAGGGLIKKADLRALPRRGTRAAEWVESVAGKRSNLTDEATWTCFEQTVAACATGATTQSSPEPHGEAITGARAWIAALGEEEFVVAALLHETVATAYFHGDKALGDKRDEHRAVHQAFVALAQTRRLPPDDPATAWRCFDRRMHSLETLWQLGTRYLTGKYSPSDAGLRPARKLSPWQELLQGEAQDTA